MAEEFDVNQKTDRNWVRVSYGLKFLRNGLQGFVDRQIQQQHEDIKNLLVNDSSNPATSCTSCSSDNLLPNHQTRQCIQKFRSKCFCSTWQNRRKCPSYFCSRFYDQIVFAHAEANPSWQNTDPSRWYTDHWELAKCFLGTTGDLATLSAKETDVTGLLSIAINDLFVVNVIDNLDNFKQAREIRNEIFHKKMFEVTDEEVALYIDRMIDVLQDKSHLLHDIESRQAVEHLNKLKQNQLTISTEDAEELRINALTAIKEITDTSKCEIEEAKLVTIKDIELKASEIEEELRNTVNNVSCQIRKTVDRTKPVTNLDISEMRQYLIEFYRNNCCRTDVLPLIPEEDVDVDEVYVPVYWEGIYKGSDRKVPIETVGQLLCLYKDTGCLKNIFVFGGVGMGKTTFCKRLVSLCCHAYTKVKSKRREFRLTAMFRSKTRQRQRDIKTDIKAIRVFDFIFLISLRYSNDEIFIEDMIQNQLYLNDLRLEVFHNIISDKRFKCLVIVDGLDEWNIVNPSNNPKSPNLAQELPRRKTLGYTVLFTSRPWKAANSEIKTSEINLKVYCNGITIQSSRELISRLVVQKKQIKEDYIVSEFLDTVELNNLNHFVQSPLLLKLIYALWEKKSALPRSRCNLYCEIYELLFQYALERNDTDFKLLIAINDLKLKSKDVNAVLPNCFLPLKNISEHKYLLSLVSKVAFNLYFETRGKKDIQATFTKDDIMNSGLTEDEFQICLKIGLLTEEKAPSTSTSRESSIFFAHFSLQEFFVALHIVLNPKDEVLTLFEQVCFDLTALSKLSNILCFVYGMYSKDLEPLNYLIGKIIKKCSSKIREGLNRKHVSMGLLVNLSLLYSDCTFENKFSGTDCDVDIQHLYLSRETIASVEKSALKIKPRHLYCYSDYWQRGSLNQISNTLFDILFNSSDLIETLWLKSIDMRETGVLYRDAFDSLKYVTLHMVKMYSKQMNILLRAPNVCEVYINNVAIAEESSNRTHVLQPESFEETTALSSSYSSIKLMQASRFHFESLDVFRADTLTCLRVIILNRVILRPSQAQSICKIAQLEKLHMHEVSCFVNELALHEMFRGGMNWKNFSVLSENNTSSQNALKSLIVTNSDVTMFRELFTKQLHSLEYLKLRRVTLSLSQADGILKSSNLQTIHLNSATILDILSEDQPEEDIRFLYSTCTEEEVSTYENIKSLTISSTDISGMAFLSSNGTSLLEQVTLENVCLNHAQATHILSSPRLHNVSIYNVACKASTSFSCQHDNCKMTDRIFAHINSLPLVQRVVVSCDEMVQIRSILQSSPRMRSFSLIDIDLSRFHFNDPMPLNHLRKVCLKHVRISQKTLAHFFRVLPGKELIVILKYITLTTGKFDTFYKNVLHSKKFKIIKFKKYTKPFTICTFFNMEMASIDNKEF